jgi:phage baseplate assembly protein gpV
LARKLTGVSTANAQLRSVDGTTYLELTSGGEANVVAPAGITLTGPVTINGTLALNGASILTGDMLLNGHLEASGNITAVEEVQGNGILLSEHIHGGVQPGGGDTSGPIG